MNADAGEVAGDEQLVQLDRTSDRLDENDDLYGGSQHLSITQQPYDMYLIELKRVQQLVQLPVLANFLELNVVLLETMQSQLSLIVDKDFQGL